VEADLEAQRQKGKVGLFSEIIKRRAEPPQWYPLFSAHLAKRIAVVTERAVGLDAEIKIKPRQAAVKAADDDVVASRVDGDRRKPLDASLKLLDKHLRLQVVDADARFRLWKSGIRGGSIKTKMSTWEGR
jgi:hypothetical protein